MAAQKGQLDSVTERLQSFGTTTIATVDQACSAALDLLEQAGSGELNPRPTRSRRPVFLSQ